jgi:hypothetical protein
MCKRLSQAPSIHIQLLYALIMMTQARGPGGLFFLFSVVLSTASSAAVDTTTSNLYACVQNALIGANVTSRIVRQSDPTYSDARTGTIV